MGSFQQIADASMKPAQDPNQVSPVPSNNGKMSSTNSASSGQAQLGQPNQNSQYTSTVTPWDNGQAPTMPNNPTSGNSGKTASNSSPQGSSMSSGKGKGA